MLNNKKHIKNSHCRPRQRCKHLSRWPSEGWHHVTPPLVRLLSGGSPTPTCLYQDSPHCAGVRSQNYWGWSYETLITTTLPEPSELCCYGRTFWLFFLFHFQKKRHVLITGQPLLPSTTQKQLCHDLNIMELRWHTSSTNHKNKHMLWNQMANFSFYTYCLNAAMVFSRFSPAPAKKKKHISVWCFGWL